MNLTADQHRAMQAVFEGRNYVGSIVTDTVYCSSMCIRFSVICNVADIGVHGDSRSA